MKQALAALTGAGLTVAACYAAGTLLLDRLLEPLAGARIRRIERLPLAFVLGAACLHLAVFAILSLQLAYWPVFLALLLSLIAKAVRSGAWMPSGLVTQPLSRPLQVLIGLTAGSSFVVYFLNAWAPEYSPDGSSYHLGLVARYLSHRGFEPVTSTFYAMLSAGVELLFVPAFAIGRHSAGALTHLAFAVALGLAMLAYGRRLGFPWVGAAGALLTFLSPVVGRTASAAYVDVATAAIVFAAFYFLELWDEQREHPAAWRLLVPAGLLCGYAYASKYTAATIGIFSLGFVAWRLRHAGLKAICRPLALIAGSAAIMAGPWIFRNWIFYDNPFAPLGNWLFRNPYVHVLFEQEYTAFLRHYNLEDKWTLPLEVTLHGFTTTGVLGPAFLLLPLGLLALREPAGRRLMLAGLVVLSTYLGNIGTRFLIPCLPFFSLAIALGVRRGAAGIGFPGLAKPALASLVVFHAVASWFSIIPLWADEYVWRIDHVPYLAALRRIPPDEYLRRRHNHYAAARLVERYVPEGESVLASSGLADSYTGREVRVNFQSGPNQLLADIFNTGWSEGNQRTRARSFRFPERPVRRIRILQTATATAPEQWNVHELRLFHQGVELARSPDWKLRAWPNPWDVQMAFDNSPATRWRSWETAAPGMYLDVELEPSQLQMIDELRLETSFDYSAVSFEVQVMTEPGVWETVANQPEDSAIPVSPAIRSMVTYELHQRGIHYLFMRDDDFGAQDIRDDPAAWGLEPLANENGERIYKTVWDHQNP